MCGTWYHPVIGYCQSWDWDCAGGPSQFVSPGLTSQDRLYILELLATQPLNPERTAVLMVTYSTSKSRT